MMKQNVKFKNRLGIIFAMREYSSQLKEGFTFKINPS